MACKRRVRRGREARAWPAELPCALRQRAASPVRVATSAPQASPPWGLLEAERQGGQGAVLLSRGPGATVAQGSAPQGALVPRRGWGAGRTPSGLAALGLAPARLSRARAQARCGPGGPRFRAQGTAPTAGTRQCPRPLPLTCFQDRSRRGEGRRALRVAQPQRRRVAADDELVTRSLSNRTRCEELPTEDAGFVESTWAFSSLGFSMS